MDALIYNVDIINWLVLQTLPRRRRVIIDARFHRVTIEWGSDEWQFKRNVREPHRNSTQHLAGLSYRRGIGLWVIRNCVTEMATFSLFCRRCWPQHPTTTAERGEMAAELWNCSGPNCCWPDVTREKKDAKLRELSAADTITGWWATRDYHEATVLHPPPTIRNPQCKGGRKGYDHQPSIIGEVKWNKVNGIQDDTSWWPLYWSFEAAVMCTFIRASIFKRMCANKFLTNIKRLIWAERTDRRTDCHYQPFRHPISVIWPEMRQIKT